MSASFGTSLVHVSCPPFKLTVFCSGGLAQRAQALLNRSSTSNTLWRQEIEPFMAHPSRLQADLRVRVRCVIKVSRAANVHSRSLGSIRSILCECEDLGSSDTPKRRVLFSFSGSDSFSSLFKDKETLHEGSELLIWEPWEDVQTSAISTMLCYRFAIATNPS